MLQDPLAGRSIKRATRKHAQLSEASVSSTDPGTESPSVPEPEELHVLLSSTPFSSNASNLSERHCLQLRVTCGVHTTFPESHSELDTTVPTPRSNARVVSARDYSDESYRRTSTRDAGRPRLDGVEPDWWQHAKYNERRIRASSRGEPVSHEFLKSDPGCRSPLLQSQATRSDFESRITVNGNSVTGVC